LIACLLGILPSWAGDYIPKVTKHVLPNGLRVLIVEDHSAPVVALFRYHKVGGVNEYSGMFGASHLLEHMMFKGTKKIGTVNYKAELPIMRKIETLVDEIDKERVKGLNDYQKMDKKKIARLWKQVKELQKEQRKYIRKNEINFFYKSQGGRDLNAYTTYDVTNYYVMLPSNKVELWAFIESDRMSNPVFREFYSERNVVYEERRMRTDNSPRGMLFENFFPHLFVAIPYGQDVVGWASDIESMRRDKVMAYLKKYYSPGNTFLALVGDVNEEEAMKLIKKYFGPIPPQPLPEPVYAQEPPRRGERRIKVKFKANPQFNIGYQGPRPGHPDQYVLTVIGRILSDGRTSRFYKNLVRKKLAYRAGAGTWELGYANVFLVFASPKKPHTSEELEKAIYAEIEKLKTTPVTSYELKKIHNNIDANYLNMMGNRTSLAIRLLTAEAWAGSWKNFFETREKLKKVTPEDIMRVAKKYLTPDNRTVSVLVKEKTNKDKDRK